jgi:hypothetical protein
MRMRVESAHDEHTWHSASALTRQVKSGGVRCGGIRSYNITTHSTEARVSLSFIVKLDGRGGVCALGQFER